MSELVQRHMEGMTEEIQEMQRTKLYTQQETNLILKKRKEFEYKINGVSKSLDDFKEYIKHERALLRQIHSRRDKLKIADRKNAIEYKIARRIRNLYEIALQRFSDEFEFSLAYFKFCKRSNFDTSASLAIQNMTKNCGHKPEVWQIAAAWYANDHKDLNTACKVINKGIIMHKTSKILYTEAINLELSAITSESDYSSKEVVCKKIKTYIEFVCECIKDYDFLIQILKQLERHPFTSSAQNLIIDKLLENYFDKEVVWDTLAQREKEGLHHGKTAEMVKESGETPLTLCFAKYQEGLKRVSASEKSDLWSKYLETLFEAQHESTTDLANSVKLNLLKSALEQASSEKFLSDRYYIKWLEIADKDEAISVLEKGTTALPHSTDLWKLRLRYTTLTEKNTLVDKVFNEAIKELKSASLPLWRTYLRYYGLLGRDDKVATIYKDALKQPTEISQALKPAYVEWLGMTKNIKYARDAYTLLASQRPYCKELHATMSRLESAELDINFEKWAQVHHLACQQFGKEDVDVWINYVLFYLQFVYKDNVDTNEKCQSIYRDAERTLSELLLTEFKEKYDKAISEYQ